MRIKYKNRALQFNLFFGIVWLAFFGLKLFFAENMHWLDYGWLIISAAYFAIYFYHKKYAYRTIENGFLNVNGPFGKTLNLTEIKRVKKFAGDYILKTNNKKVTIHTFAIDPDSSAALNEALKELNVEWE